MDAPHRRRLEPIDWMMPFVTLWTVGWGAKAIVDGDRLSILAGVLGLVGGIAFIAVRWRERSRSRR